ncbi:MAG: DUF1697 domain-containing protein [Flavobacteriaceae bacterium]|nr:DUF1697 domain-containing protein [Flavobacteriaceae bacterium]
MKTYVALLRGINVGGHKKFLKADQLEMLSKLGVSSPRVCLHTGNWIFESSESKENLKTKISKLIKNEYGWEVPTIVRTHSEIKAILDKCPFKGETLKKSYFVILSKPPSQEKIAEISKLTYPKETFYLTSQCVYLFSQEGASKAKLSNNFFENKLKVEATTRNYNTMLKLVELSA